MKPEEAMGTRINRCIVLLEQDQAIYYDGPHSGHVLTSAQGRIDAAVQGSETLPYIMDLEPGAYTPVGETIASQFTGIALPVKEKGLQQAMVEAVDALIADGTYRTLLAKWKLNDNGIEKATINAGQ